MLLHIVIQQNKFSGVSITKEIASFELLAVASYLHAGSAMIKSVTTLWIGDFLDIIIIIIYLLNLERSIM